LDFVEGNFMLENSCFSLLLTTHILYNILIKDIEKMLLIDFFEKRRERMVGERIVEILKYVVSYDLPVIVVVLLAIWVGKLVNDLLTRYKIDEELTGKNNPAVGVALAGYYIGLAIAIAGVVIGPADSTLTKDLLDIAIYSVMAIILMNVATFINDKLILYKFDDQKELINDQNSGTGAVMAGSYLATGFIINASVSGELAGGWWKGLLACLIFFILGQVVLVITGIWYQIITKYDVHKAIGDNNNVAAGISFGGFLLSMGYIVSSAMTGESESWALDLASFGLYVVIALIILTLGQWITDKVFLPKAKTSEEVGVQANIAAAAISIAINLSVAILVVHVL